MNEINTETKDLSPVLEKVDRLRKEFGKLIVGQEKSVELMLVALLADGHILIEGVPGVAKTLAARIMAKSISADFSRIQFTPDLMPADIIGTSVYNNKTNEFEFRKGPLFSNIVLIDEINRAPAKTQSALFEVMEERNITADGTTYALEEPFLVLGTQNPVEHEGTYRLPEAQLDRFLFKLEVDYPELNEEVAILKSFQYESSKDRLAEVEACLSAQELKELRDLTRQVQVEDKLFEYIAQLVSATRNNPDIFLGASPRASLGILNAAKALAALNNRNFITPDDVKYVATPVLVHRIVPAPEKEIEGIMAKQIIDSILKKIEVPR